MSDTHYWAADYDLSSATASPPAGAPCKVPAAVGGPQQHHPMGAHAELGTALCLVGLLLLLLLFLVLRCVRILLDPYSSMPSSSWTHHNEGPDRGQFDYALV
ncbi:unnamed protein product [Merluccius merluccius]